MRASWNEAKGLLDDEGSLIRRRHAGWCGQRLCFNLLILGS
jgi:hypothetical protein